jgi:hypothetical protein
MFLNEYQKPQKKKVYLLRIYINILNDLRNEKELKERI